MSSYPPPGPGGAGRRFEDAIGRVEAELRNAVDYMNDRVVPQVRRESIAAMRRMAETLGKLADRVERNTAPRETAETVKTEDRKG
jgi:hypothetical protein